MEFIFIVSMLVSQNIYLPWFHQRTQHFSLVFPVKKEYLSNSKKIIFSGFSCIVAVIISVSITTSYQVLFFFYMISFFEMPLPSQETDWWCTYICVLMVIGFAYRMFLWFIHYILELVWWCTCICVLGVIELVWWCTCICVLGVIELVWWCGIFFFFIFIMTRYK